MRLQWVSIDLERKGAELKGGDSCSSLPGVLCDNDEVGGATCGTVVEQQVGNFILQVTVMTSDTSQTCVSDHVMLSIHLSLAADPSPPST